MSNIPLCGFVRILTPISILVLNYKLSVLLAVDRTSELSRYHMARIKLVSHWHANFSRLFCEFCRGTFARHSCECRASVVRIFLCRELVAKFFNMLKNFMRIFSPKYFARLSRDSRATVARRSRDVRVSVANLSPRNFGEFTMRNFRDTRTNVARVSHDGRATVLRKPRDYLARK